jgi:hypothetical protein
MHLAFAFAMYGVEFQVYLRFMLESRGLHRFEEC